MLREPFNRRQSLALGMGWTFVLTLLRIANADHRIGEVNNGFTNVPASNAQNIAWMSEFSTAEVLLLEGIWNFRAL